MRILIGLMVLSIVAGAACKTSTVVDEEIPLTASASTGCVDNPQWAFSAKRGVNVFSENCAYCHDANGSGNVGKVPALANNAGLAADPERGIRMLMITSSPQARMHGMEYDDMVAILDDLTEKDLADALTYILSSWGNCAGPIVPAQIKAVADSM